MLTIGHRGARGHAPENTIASIHRALELGARHVEVDVHVVEGHLVVIHDERLERTTDGTGRVAEQSFDAIRRLDAGGGQRIPTLDEVWHAVRGRAALNVELKGEGTAEPFAEWAVLRGVDDTAMLVSSFEFDRLVRIRTLRPSARIGVLFGAADSRSLDGATDIGAYSVHPPVSSVTREWVAEAHAAGMRVFAYTVNDPDAMRRLEKWGVDGIFTDYPDRGVAVSETEPPHWM